MYILFEHVVTALDLEPVTLGILLLPLVALNGCIHGAWVVGGQSVFFFFFLISWINALPCELCTGF